MTITMTRPDFDTLDDRIEWLSGETKRLRTAELSFEHSLNWKRADEAASLRSSLMHEHAELLSFKHDVDKAKADDSHPERFVRSAHGVYLTVDGGLPLEEAKLVGCTLFKNRALMVEDMFHDPLQNSYSCKEDADAVIYRVSYSEPFGEVVLIDDRGMAAPIADTIVNFLNTYQI